MRHIDATWAGWNLRNLCCRRLDPIVNVLCIFLQQFVQTEQWIVGSRPPTRVPLLRLWVDFLAHDRRVKSKFVHWFVLLAVLFCGGWAAGQIVKGNKNEMKFEI